MKNLLTMVALGLSLSLGMVHSADAKAKTAQQEKMATCNKDAAGKKGDERKAFMKECLSAKSAEPAAAAASEPSKKATQQEKMKSCNKDAGAKKLKGDERKKFMSECLKA